MPWILSINNVPSGPSERLLDNPMEYSSLEDALAAQQFFVEECDAYGHVHHSSCKNIFCHGGKNCTGKQNES